MDSDSKTCGSDRLPLERARAALAQARHLLVDLDGTLVRDDGPLEGAARLLERFRGRYAVVSNNSTHTAPTLVRRLARMGLQVDPGRLVLAGEQAVDYMRRNHPGARLLLAASPVLQRYALAAGCDLVCAGADFVVLALDRRLTHARLGLLADELRRGARLVVTNGDGSHPGAGGAVVPETGALMAALVAASGVQPWKVLGKPGALLLHEGLRRLGADPASTVMVGDNPETDGLGASRLGMDCVLVGGAPQAAAPTLAALLAEAAPPQYRLSESTSKVLRSVLTDLL
jgi:4-nitrophenyl phosphatase